jgi:hypothetical protein
MSCRICAEFCGDVRIELPDDLRRVVDVVGPAVRDGRLVIDAGDLQWQDIIDCRLHCAKCGQRFTLTCETYHGSGGSWSTV